MEDRTKDSRRWRQRYMGGKERGEKEKETADKRKDREREEGEGGPPGIRGFCVRREQC